MSEWVKQATARHVCVENFLVAGRDAGAALSAIPRAPWPPYSESSWHVRVQGVEVQCGRSPPGCVRVTAAEFKGSFARVVFAIIDPVGTGNLRPFKTELRSI